MIKKFTHDQLVQRIHSLKKRLEINNANQLKYNGNSNFKNSIFEVMGDLVFILDPDFTILDVNPSACRATGADKKDLLGKKCFELMHRSKKPPENCPFLTAIETKTVQHSEMYVQALDKYFLVSCTPFYDQNHHLEKTIHIATDINDLHMAKQALSASENMFRMIADYSSDIIWTLDLNTCIVYISPAVEQMLGYAPKELIGRHISMLLTPDSFKKAMEAVSLTVENLKTGKGDDASVILELDHICKDSRIIKTEMVANKVLDENGRLKLFIGITRDITERSKREKEALTANKLDALGVLAGGLAHDFNNLLSIMLGNMEMCREDMKQGLPTDHYMVEVIDSIFKAKEITDILVTLSDGSNMLMWSGDLKTLIESTLSVIPRKRVEVHTVMAPDLPRVRFDENHLGRALENILVNAVEAMPEKGRLRLAVQTINISGKFRPETLSKGKYVEIRITDTGKGIPSADLPFIFDPYFSTKERGPQKAMGLGLTLAYAIIKKHGGDINVSSTAGKGTTISVYLPVAVYSETLSVDRAAATAISRVLLMDDEPRLRKLARAMLERLGYEACTAENGEAAISAFEKAIKEKKPFDRVILDLTVRVGMGGKETLAALKKIDPGVNAIVSSGYNKDPVMIQHKRFGFCGAIPKPYSKDQLAEALKKTVKPVADG